MSLAGMSCIGRYVLCEEAALARTAGRYEPYWPLICCVKRLFWPVLLAVMSRSGRYSPYGVAVLALSLIHI